MVIHDDFWHEKMAISYMEREILEGLQQDYQLQLATDPMCSSFNAEIDTKEGRIDGNFKEADLLWNSLSEEGIPMTRTRTNSAT